jgi:hypothetical protein
LEEVALEEIPARLIPPTKAGVESSFGWRQAQSEVPTETYLEVQSRKVLGDSTSYSIECW